jgi:2-polyprenyl-3-methyl-5-hydroxy-6-metoxy-1,4-benzoquinol methylase
MKPIISHYLKRKKVDYFFKDISKEVEILEVGGAEGWLRNYLKTDGWHKYTSLDITPPADYVGDILEWRSLGMKPKSFDVIVAFEVVEHVNCFQACYDLLRDGGKMMITTPVPRMDWALKMLEFVHLNQRRTSEHNNLVDLRDVQCFAKKNIKNMAGLSQWAVFVK